LSVSDWPNSSFSRSLVSPFHPLLLRPLLHLLIPPILPSLLPPLLPPILSPLRPLFSPLLPPLSSSPILPPLLPPPLLPAPLLPPLRSYLRLPRPSTQSRVDIVKGHLGGALASIYRYDRIHEQLRTYLSPLKLQLAFDLQLNPWRNQILTKTWWFFVTSDVCADVAQFYIAFLLRWYHIHMGLS